MSDITASERRLTAALDRLDRLLETAPAPAADAGLIARLTGERDAALARAEAAEHAPGGDAPDSAALTDLQARLEAAVDQAARMSAANEELMTANRDLLEAQATGGIGPDEGRAALEAEIAALRAARAAEMAQMSEIMTELERLLAADPGSAGDAAPLALHATEAAGDGAGLPDIEDGAALPDTDDVSGLPDTGDLPDQPVPDGAPIPQEDR